MTSAADQVRNYLAQTIEVKARLASSQSEAIVAAAQLLVGVFRGGGKLLLCGNGGSAADCQHMAAEFVSRLTKEFDRPGIPAIALTTDTSFLTAYANDVDFEGIFARQVQALGRPGDALLGISTSGNSKNVLRAVEVAKQLGMKTVGLAGAAGQLAARVDAAVSVPSTDTQFIQESHLAIEHLIAMLVEQALYGNSSNL